MKLSNVKNDSSNLSNVSSQNQAIPIVPSLVTNVGSRLQENIIYERYSPPRVSEFLQEEQKDEFENKES